ncbi:hypothetical protein [Rhodoluna sp.]|uniref:hypothetical protein n=1 Tax=Rhodoluna sp. TaxID=1969481 RepID=UPI0025E57ED5|nr:hypothetical protein [Rhodoluna sp.]
MRISQIIQASAALVAGLLITFSQKHDAQVAMLGLLILSIGWVLASAVAVFKRQSIILHSIVAIGAMAMIAYSQSFVANEATTQAWILLMSWGLFGAILELIFALRAGKKTIDRRDFLINSGLAIFLLLSQISITDAADSVSRVGFFGAYAILLAVHLGISAASPRTTKA